MKTTKKALLSAIVAVVITCAMFIGSTFAWFTDQAESKGNKVVAGTFDMDLRLWKGENAFDVITKDSDPLFTEDIDGQWEPGKTSVRYLSIRNNGSLDMKYTVSVIVSVPESEILAVPNAGEKAKELYDEMEYKIIPNAKYGEFEGWGDVDGVGVSKGANITDSQNVVLTKGAEHFFALAIHMDEDAGLEYAGGIVDFDIKVIAGQVNDRAPMGKEDNITMVSPANIPSGNIGEGNSATVSNESGTFKLTTKAGTDGSFVADIKPTNTQDSVFDVCADAGKSVVSYDISASGKDENDVAKVEIYVGKNLFGVEVWHKGNLMTPSDSMEDGNYSYNATTGYVTFYTKNFSPFDITFYTAEDIPVASVTKLGLESINTTEGMGGDAYVMDMHTSYRFATTESYEDAQKSPYGKWHADFVVKLNDTAPANSIALAGYYEAFCAGYNKGNWVALYSYEDIPADTEVRLLQLLLNGGSMNYEELCNYVPTFDCGAVAFSDAVIGDTLTVELRLYETKDPSETGNNTQNEETGRYVTICKYQYTFDKVAVNPFN